MAERPSAGASGIRFSHRADDGPDRSRLSVNDDQRCRQLQDEETQTKKTENGKINGFVVEGEENPTSLDLDSSLHSARQNGDKLLESDLKPNPSGQPSHTGLKGERKGNNTIGNSMDCKNDKSSELTTHEGKKEALASLNGVVPLSCGPLTNGYLGQSGTDNDGSGSESGYTTPKKRRAQRNGKSLDNVTALSQAKAMQQASKQELGPATLEQVDRTSAAQVEISRPSSKTDSHFSGLTKREVTTTPPVLPVSEVYRKSTGKKFEDKATKAKVAASTKEDSWTLFKPPPVFPVDNSSAKIVPKISYASKVKENLNKAAQTGTEIPTPAPQVPGRPSQVPMSAVKTITSASFSNGDGNTCPLPGPHFTSVPGSSPMPVVSSAGSDHVASFSSSSCNAPTFTATTTTSEPRKPNLFVYPLSASSSSNMQLSLPSGRQSDPSPSQKSLGDIFQNQWGLSFINEPSSGSEGPTCSSIAKDKIGEVSFQGGSIAILTMQTHSAPQKPDQPAFPEKRTSAQSVSKGGNLTLSAASVVTKGSLQSLKPEADTLKDEPGVSSAIAFCSSSKDVGAELPHLTLPRDQGLTKDVERTASWHFFDLKAAVVYHTKEMEYILNLQKQDPNRVVFYSESKNGPDQ